MEGIYGQMQKTFPMCRQDNPAKIKDKIILIPTSRDNYLNIFGVLYILLEFFWQLFLTKTIYAMVW